ncbi:MAG: hypothetical protein FJ125_08460, partial [Deltaproteobacteria bacterium]|nr:hypothetical protein [Deltaproteobacteria bacterium]
MRVCPTGGVIEAVSVAWSQTTDQPTPWIGSLAGSRVSCRLIAASTMASLIGSEKSTLITLSTGTSRVESGGSVETTWGGTISGGTSGSTPLSLPGSGEPLSCPGVPASLCASRSRQRWVTLSQTSGGSQSESRRQVSWAPSPSPSPGRGSTHLLARQIRSAGQSWSTEHSSSEQPIQSTRAISKASSVGRLLMIPPLGASPGMEAGRPSVQTSGPPGPVPLSCFGPRGWLDPISGGRQGSRSVAFETTVAIRQLRAGRSGSLSMLTAIAVVGVILAVAALVTVMSVTGGFQRLFREKVLGLNAHILVMRYGLDFTEYRQVMARAAKVPGVQGASPFLFHEMMISAGDVLGGVMVKGIDPGSVDQVSDLRHYVHPGEGGLDALRPAEQGAPPGILLGRELAGKLGVEPGDPVLLVSPLKGMDPTSFSSRDLAPTSATFTVKGVYHSGFYEYDARLVFVHYRALQSFFHQPDTVTGVELKVDDIFATQTIARQVRVKLGDQRYSVQSWAAAQVELLEQATARRDAVRWAIFVALLLLSGAALTLLLLPTRRSRVLRGLGAALLATSAGTGLVAALLGGWGSGLVSGPELGLVPHLRIQRDGGDFLEYRNALAEARSLPEVSEAGAYISGTARVLPSAVGGKEPPAVPAEERSVVKLRGFDSEAGGLPLRRYVTAGRIGYLVPPMLPSARMPPYRTVLGKGLARSLGLAVGDVFHVLPDPLPGGTPQPDVGPYAMEVAALV